MSGNLGTFGLRDALYGLATIVQTLFHVLCAAKQTPSRNRQESHAVAADGSMMHRTVAVFVKKKNGGWLRGDASYSTDISDYERWFVTPRLSLEIVFQCLDSTDP